MSTSTLRFAALAATAGIVLVLPESRHGNSQVYNLILFTVGMSHYMLSFHYARRRIRELASLGSARVPLLVVAAVGVGFALAGHAAGDLGHGLLFYFGIHHALNEYYMTAYASPKSAPAPGLCTASAVFHLAFYFLIVINDRAFLAVYRDAVALCALISAAVYLLVLLRGGVARSSLPSAWTLLFEGVVAGLGVSAYLQLVHFRFVDVVLFHFLYWLAYPVLKLSAAGAKAIHHFILENVALATGFALLALLAPRALPSGLFDFGSFVHISAAFALSAANPAWIRARFPSSD